MAIIASDDFTGVGTSLITGRTLNNALGGSGTRTWALGNTAALLGNGSDAVTDSTGGSSRSWVDMTGTTPVKWRMKFNPAGTTPQLAVVGKSTTTNLTTTSGISALLISGHTELRIREFVSGAANDRGTNLTITAPGTTFWLEVEVDGLTVYARVLNADTSVRNQMSWTASSLPSGVYCSPGYYFAGNTGSIDDFVAFDATTADTEVPTLTGSITIGAKTTSSIAMSWPAGSDNVAVTSYEVSSNGGSSWTDVGNVLTYTFTGLSAGTSYNLRVRAKDAAGNVSTPALAATESTVAADSTPPTMSGSITVGTKTSGSISISYPAASDNVAVTGYEVRVNGGTWLDNGLTLSYTFLGLAALTSYTLDVRAYDAAGNRAVTPLTVTTSTYRAGDTAANILANTGPVGGNPAGALYAFASTVTSTDWLSYYTVSGPNPSGGTLNADPDGKFDYVGPDAATWVIQPEVNGVAAAETITITLYTSTPDTTLPVLAGSITVANLTSTSYDLSWPTGTDNIGVTAYEYSLNGGTSWTSQAGTSVSITGRTPESTDQVRVRAKDAAGNYSTPPLAVDVTLLAAPDVTPPTLTSPTGAKLGAYGGVGSVSTNEPTGSLYWITTTSTTEGKAAVLAGNSQPVTASGVQYVTSSGLIPLTSYYNHFVHVDGSGNESLVSSTTAAFTTDAAGAVVTSKFNDGQAMRGCMWNPMKKAINA